MLRVMWCAVPLLLCVALATTGCAKKRMALRPQEAADTSCELCAGMPAPEIAGEDIDGIPFKLSDYKGRVVLLDFWGNW